MAGLRAASASVEIRADDDMVIGGSILPGFCNTQEAPLRASALAIVGEAPVCIISLDVLAFAREYADAVAERIHERLGVPVGSIMITATHTHHAPTTMTVHGYEADSEFCSRVADAAVEAAANAFGEIEAAAERPNDSEAELLYGLGSEQTIGHNSRWIIDDGQITWYGSDPSVSIRPTGPHDADLPVLALRRATGELAGALFVHATHNIGTLSGATRSPGFFGLAAQALERKHGGAFLFAPGAFGSSHRPDNVPPDEAMARVVAAVDDTLDRLQPALDGPIAAIKRPFTCTHRAWDEGAEDAAVRRWCDRWYDAETAETYAQVFAEMRAVMAPRAGAPLDTWLQIIRLGDVAIVGVPGEMFGALGLDIRCRSPFRNTIVIGLANDEIGYIADRRGYTDGGYQAWVGLHNQVEPGTAERMVDAIVEMLRELSSGAATEATMEPLRPDDGCRLQAFYNGLGPHARWLFRPLGWNATHESCRAACREAEAGDRLDYVLRANGRIVGWAFLLSWRGDVPHLGIGIADDHCGKGHGKRLMRRLIEDARAAGKRGVELIHVKENDIAGGLYRSVGFQETGERTGPDGNDYWEMRLDL